MRKLSTLMVVICLCGLLAGALSTVQAEEGDWLVRSRLIVIAPNDDADGALGAAGTEVEDNLTIEVDATYFFTPRFAIEGILATAAQEVTQGATSLGAINHAPATFTAQYHFKPDGEFRPYAGAGINYTIFYDESGDLADLSLDSGSFGLAGQVGLDIMIGDNKMFNLDAKYIDIDIKVDGAGTVDINPLVIGAGFGVRF